MTRWVVEVGALLEPGSAIVILLAIFCAAVVTVFVRHVGEVLRAVLDEHDPVRQRILRDVLRDLLELFRPARHRLRMSNVMLAQQ